MTTLPPNADELVSAYLDGEAAPDEVELVESSDELLARVASMRAVSEALAAPIAPSPEVREMHLAAALAAFDDLALGDQTDTVDPIGGAVAGSGSGGGDGGRVASLDEARQRRRPRRLNGLIAAAAAALLLFVGITALTVSRTNDGFDTAAEDAGLLKEPAEDSAEMATDTFSADAAADDADDAANATMAAPADEAVEEESAASDAAGAMMAEAPAAEAAMADDAADGEADSSLAARAISPTDPAVFFGSFADIDGLAAYLQAEFPIDDLRDRTTDETVALVPSCQVSVAELAGATSSTLVGTAEVDGIFSEVHLVPDQSRVLLVEPFNCTVADQIPVSEP